MPSPTEQISTENFPLPPLPLKDPLEPVENVMEPSQESDSHVNPEGDHITAIDNEVHEGQGQQGTTSPTVAAFATSPSHMTDVIVNDNANVTTTTTTTTTSTAPITSPPNDDTTATSTTNTTQPTIIKANVPSGKRKYTRRQKEDPPRQRVSRRTRNTSKSTISPVPTQQPEQSTTPVRRTSSASASSPQLSTTRRGTASTIDVDLNSQIDLVDSNGRQLPSKEGINQTNISERFVDFIMYCNPSAPETLDKAALVRSFNAVPKSDGKVFQTWSLYQLVGKHYAGEIRTWTKLAQKLGVVRTPEASPQKIQQYAVRLKKWMASVHVDAYFDYLLSRTNDYYQSPQRNPTEASDDESDVVLKLIKRAGSKRQKRKYTRKNTNTSNISANDDGVTHSEGVSRGNDTADLDDEVHFESEDADEGADKHRDKRVRSYSDDNEASEEEDDRDPWGMELDEEEEPEHSTEQTGSNQRRKSVVQVGFGPRWVKDNAEEEESENVVGGRLGVRKEANPENDSSRYYRQYPSQFASNLVGLPHLIEPKNGSNIPTPNPSPTTLPDMILSSGNVTGSKRVLSHSGATGGAGTQKLRWRISTGPTHAGKSSADQSYLTTSPPSSQKDPKRKQDAGQDRESKPVVRPPRNIAIVPNEQLSTDGPNYAEMFLHSGLPSDDRERIETLQKKLIQAVGMLEDHQRKIKTLDGIVRQRDEDVRQRVVRAIKDEVNAAIERFQ